MNDRMTFESPWQRRLTRRRLLGATGAAAALAAAACSRGGGGQPTPFSPTAEPSASPTRAPSPSPTTLSSRHGHTLRHTGFVERDAFADPHKTQAGPLLGHQAMVFSRLLTYQDQARGTIAADLAAALPERPDATTLVFRINPQARWHDLPPLNGRPVTADDVKFSIERQRSGDTTFVRAPQWAAIDSIEVTSPQTITFKLKAPLAAAHHLFADVASFIVAPELAPDGRDIPLDAQVGSGPFLWVEWSDQRFASVRRNPAWFGGDRRPYLEGISLVQPRTTAEVESGLRTRALDVAIVSRTLADHLKRGLPQLVEYTIGHSMFFSVRYSLVNHPYNDQRFRNALTWALDRREMVRKFFDGSGGLSPWISWPVTRWTLPESELTTVPGYRPGDGGREADLRDARAALEAFRSEKQLPADPLPLFVVDATENAIGLGSLIRDQLKAALDLDIRIVPMPLSQLVGLLLSAEAPFAAGPDTGWIDLDDWVYPYFHSAGTRNSFPLRDSDLDALIEKQRVELNEDARRNLGYEIQRRILALNPGANLVSERVVALAWPYVKGYPLDTTDGYQDRFASCWIDASDPTFRGRA
ncbi:ABC transporter substrate-binding protein [Tepidiforma bonchosmolovskayae]|uniref:ABC transporter substrate-binding protein n=2 Tax=Tepidiforma bonchosmolovskayae TaxID=2601677 RepID=A0ABX6C2Z0_9CHLR|nr:ABC transporter substrate-binding protein [Tepidiforma bonchosmolovskayae]